MIGILGGIGPMAGADLYKKIVENTVALIDQEHLPVLLASIPNEIPDRTSFLLGKTSENPAPALAKVILLLERAGATHIGIACNAAHSPQIFGPMWSILQQNDSKVTLVNMIDEALRSIQNHPGHIQRVGLLCTSGTYRTHMYQERLESNGFTPLLLDFERHQALVQEAIFAIKAASTQVPQAPIDLIDTAILELKNLGAQAVLLACTELGMIEERLDTHGLALFNPNLVLARTLISHTFPQKLKP